MVLEGGGAPKNRAGAELAGADGSASPLTRAKTRGHSPPRACAIL